MSNENFDPCRANDVDSKLAAMQHLEVVTKNIKLHH